MGLKSGWGAVLGLALVGLTWGVAVRADAAPPAPIVALLPPTGIVGDGVTVADLYFLALDASGEPAAEVKLRAHSRFGSTTELPEPLGGGLYRVKYTPADQERSEILSVELSGKIGKSNVRNSFPIQVHVNPARQLTLSTSPAAIVLGVDKSASIQLSVAGKDLSGLDLLVAASSGTVTNLTNLGNGKFNALYTPPADNVPREVILTAADRRDPTVVYAHTQLGLTATATPVVTGPKGSRVLLRVGSREFGPAPVDSKGRAKVPIQIPPGVRAATVLALGADGTTSESSLDLKLPEPLRMAFAPSSVLPGDPTVSHSLHLIVRTPDLLPDPTATPVVSAALGKVASTQHIGNGIYVVNYSPPLGLTAVTDTLTASLGSGPTTTLSVSVGPARPSALSLAATPPKLPIGPTLSVLATVTGPGGALLPGRTLSWQANGAQEGVTKDLKNGTYQAPFTPFSTGPVEIEGRVCTPASGNNLDRMLLVANREHVLPDGLSVVRFTAIGVDHFGYPVADLDLDLSLVYGDGALPAKVKTDSCGMASVYYTAGSATTPVAVRAIYNTDVEASAVVFQGPKPLTVSIPRSGPPTFNELVGVWAGSFADLRVE